ncbi:MAG: glutamine-hydrolyzing GMP synthase, partial [Clostridia bacterium]|nr:glutamine-hydrolyzing GMP synthase [Clostridia bacterium]
MEQETILILDFGGQYKQLIARRVRECQVYSEILPHTTPIEELRARAPKGIILTGGPNSVYDPASPTCSPELFSLGVPVLGICYGAQLMAHLLGGQVAPADTSEYGGTALFVDDGDSPLLRDVPKKTSCWMSHTDRITAVPPGFTVTAHTPDCPVAAMEDRAKRLYAVQLHPEVAHTPEGAAMLRRFVREVCGCQGTWQMSSFVTEQIQRLQERIGTKRVL